MKTIYRCMDWQETITLITMRWVSYAGRRCIRFEEGDMQEAAEACKKARNFYTLVGLPRPGHLEERDEDGKRVTNGYSLADFQAFALLHIKNGEEPRTVASSNILKIKQVTR